MTTPFRLLALLFLLASTHARGQGISFFQGDLNSLFAKAAAEHKPVYVDVYTSWCGPCKLMAKTVFPDSAVGRFMNGAYLAYKIDAEKGEGVPFAAKHKVAAYPTGLYFNPGGEMVFQSVGYENATRFVATAKRALAEIQAPENILTLRKAYQEGRREPAQLLRYLDKLRSLDINGLEAMEAAAATLKVLSPAQRMDAEVLKKLALANTDGDPDVYAVCMASLPEIKAVLKEDDRDLFQNAMLGANQHQLPAAIAIGREKLQERLNDRRRILAGVEGRDERSLAQDEAYMRVDLAQNHKRPDALNPEVPAFVERYWLSQTDSSLKIENAALLKEVREQLVAYGRENNLSEERRKEMLAEYEGKDLSRERLASDLNTFAWAYYQMKRPAGDLKLALRWIDYALKLRPAGYAALDTKAHLQAALGQRAAALATERKALALAKAADEDTEEYVAYIRELGGVKTGSGAKKRGKR